MHAFVSLGCNSEASAYRTLEVSLINLLRRHSDRHHRRSENCLNVRNDRAASLQATLFVGGQVPEWREVMLDEAIDVEKFDQTIADQATKLGIDTSKPFMFAVEGEFQNVRLHVINGTCPLHSRLRKKTIAAEQKPREQELEKVSGRLVRCYAKNAAGKLAHPPLQCIPT